VVMAFSPLRARGAWFGYRPRRENEKWAGLWAGRATLSSGGLAE